MEEYRATTLVTSYLQKREGRRLRANTAPYFQRSLQLMMRSRSEELPQILGLPMGVE